MAENAILYFLAEEEAWLLLQEQARIDDSSASSMLHEVARGVAMECRGAPLAIEAVGATLRGKSVDEWKIALDRLRDSKPADIEEGVRNIFACIRLSYDHLRSSLEKSLFLLCALFPENHQISKEDLFRYGEGLGLCGDVMSLDMARNCVNEGINMLIDSFLLKHSEEGQDHVKMHCVVRDVALWVASHEGCAIMVNVANDLEAKAKESFAVSSWNEGIHQLPDQLDAPKLEVLLLNTEYGFELSNVSFEGLKVLKVMAIVTKYHEATALPSLPQSIHLLTNIRILRLVNLNFDDITSVVTLEGLEILDLHFSRFNKQPEGLTQLNRLRLLDLSWCIIEEDCYEVAGRCSQLEELYAFAIIHNSGRMESYKCFLDHATFPKLHKYALRIGKLYSEGFFVIHYDVSRRIIHVGEVNTSNLGSIMKDLLQRAEEVGLDTLYGGCRSVFPELVQAIGGMDELSILCLRQCSELECIINTASDQADSFQVEAMLPKLLKLELIHMSSLIEVCHGVPLLRFFEKLQQLHIEKCHLLQSIFPRTCYLHHLKTLKIYGCPLLTSLPSMSAARTLVQLQELVVVGCKKLKQIIETSEGDRGEASTPHVAETACLMFSKLKTLTVYDCDKLEFILPVSC